MTEFLIDEYPVASDSSLDLTLVSHTTIADLPNELLEYIFVINSLHNFQHIHNPAQTIRWISQVCQRWRVIAVNTPLLWARIVDLESHSRWINEVLNRARSVPLDLMLPCISKDLMDKSLARTMLLKSPSSEMIDLAATRAPKVWHSLWYFLDEELLGKCLPKTRSIILSISTLNWSWFLRPTMITYLPKLERFSLVAFGNETGLFGDRGELTGGPPWNLRSLNLRKCNFLFDGLSLPFLEELTIHHLPASQVLPPSTWLSMLENLPKLKCLELVNVTPIQEEDAGFSHLERAVQLVDLQWLLLSGPLCHCVNILENLDIPPSCKMDLMTYEFSSLREEFYSLVNIIGRKFNAAEDVIFGDTLRLFLSPGTFVFNAFNNKDRVASTPRSLFHLCMSWQTASDNGVPPPYINPFTVLHAMTTALRRPCLSVTKLHINFDVAAEPKERIKVLARLFSNFNNLKHLHHIMPSTLPFVLSYFEFLSQPTRMTDSGTDFSKFLPLMNAISFLDVNFASLHPSSPNLLKLLHGFVASRLTDLNVSPITWMTFEACRAMSKKGINRLANVGVQLNLDKYTCENCDIRSDGPPYGWRIILPLVNVKVDFEDNSDPKIHTARKIFISV